MDIRSENYHRLFEVSRDLASTLDLNPLLDRIVHAAADIADAEAASILLYDDAAQQLYFQAATNLDQPMMKGLIVPLEGSIAGWIINNRMPVRTGNVNDDERHFNEIANATSVETHSLIGIPLITKDKVIGVLEVINKSNGEFTKTDEDLLTVLGAQAAVAIENARLFQQSDLVAEFVHELRTPLTSINTAAYLLLNSPISYEQREQVLSNVYTETLRLNSLASTFLDLARLESGRVQFRKEEFEIEPLLRECVDVMRNRAEENRVTLTLEDPADLQCEADRDKLKQVLLNLLSNAIKYNRPEGNVILMARESEEETILSVEDTGIGIPADSIPMLFQKFYRVRETERKVSGTGLGLSICKHIVQGHNGRIEVQSHPGKGSIFSVFLPKKAK